MTGSYFLAQQGKLATPYAIVKPAIVASIGTYHKINSKPSFVSTRKIHYPLKFEHLINFFICPDKT